MEEEERRRRTRRSQKSAQIERERLQALITAHKDTRRFAVEELLQYEQSIEIYEEENTFAYLKQSL